MKMTWNDFWRMIWDTWKITCNKQETKIILVVFGGILAIIQLIKIVTTIYETNKSKSQQN